MTELLYILVSILLIIMCGIFVAAEFSFLALNRNTMERRATKGNRKAIGVMKSLKTLSMQLSGAQVGITITNLAIGFLAEPTIAIFLKPPLAFVGVPDTAISGISITLGMIIATAIVMIFGELIPKNLALAKPNATAEYIQGPQRFFTSLMKRPIWLLNSSANIVLRKFGIEPKEELASARSAEELVSVIRRSADHGKMPQDVALMMTHSLDFGDFNASDVMTPRVLMKTIHINDTLEGLLSYAKRTGFSRFPVTRNSIDDIIGVVHIKSAIKIEKSERDKVTVDRIMQKPLFVPSSIELEPLLPILRESGMQMAIVCDEHGGIDGIVTIEDLLEELVGELEDEHDDKDESINKLGPNKWVVSGLLRTDEVGEDIGLNIPEDEDFETISGLINDKLGRIPTEGEYVIVDIVDNNDNHKKLLLKVKSMNGHRVDLAELTVIDKTITEEDIS